MGKLDVNELLKDIKRVHKSRSIGDNIFRRRDEKINDFIKRKANYRCNYCHKKMEKGKLRVSIENFHIVKERETLNKVLNYYKLSKKEMKNLNPKLNLKSVGPGSLLRVPGVFKIFPRTHGVCFCKKCGDLKNKLNMDHVRYVDFLITNRKRMRRKVKYKIKEKVFKRDQYKCVYCVIEYGKSGFGLDLTIDHKKPIVAGGDTVEENLCTSCSYHNLDKGGESYEEYVKKIKKRKYFRENGVEIKTVKNKN